MTWSAVILFHVCLLFKVLLIDFSPYLVPLHRGACKIELVGVVCDGMG